MDTFRIRDLRLVKGMTVAQLAAAANVSSALVSQVERGLADPSLETLRQIARVLDVPIFELFLNDADEGRVTVMRRNEHAQITSPTSDIRYSRLSATAGQLEVLRGQLAPGGASTATAWSHPAEECIVVISGTLSVEIDGTALSLDEGDSCHFDSRLPHRLVNDGKRDSVFIVSVTPPSY